MSISFENVSYVYQPKTPYEHLALKDIVTEFKEGRYYAIVGHTGSGKSTLVQHMNGLLKPTHGTLHIREVTVKPASHERYLKEIRKRVGIVFQFPESQLFEDTVEREILFGPKNFKMNLATVKENAFRLLKEFGFEDHIMTQSPFQLSGGQMRKIALASILAMDPEVIILDEPTAGLDPESKRQVMRLIKRLQVEEGKTIVLITHEMNDVAQYADEVKIMKKGALIDSCSPRILFENTSYVEELHLNLPDVVKLQRAIENKHNIKFGKTALTEEEFVAMYEEWRDDER